MSRARIMETVTAERVIYACERGFHGSACHDTTDNKNDMVINNNLLMLAYSISAHCCMFSFALFCSDVVADAFVAVSVHSWSLTIVHSTVARSSGGWSTALSAQTSTSSRPGSRSALMP